MYINEVIESVDRLLSNEYDLEEKYRWCDELSAMLTQEYRKEYDKVTLKADENGDYLLPENVLFEMIDRIFDGRYMLDKQDFRSDGVMYLSGINRRIALPKRYRAKGDIDVIYIRQHEPIRRGENIISATGNVQKNGLFAPYKEIKGLRAGDTVNIEWAYEDDDFIKDNAVDDVPLLFVTDVDGEECFLTFPNNTLANAIPPSGEKYKFRLTRIVTDKTICTAPYDSMYIDYLLAKICYYQHDYESYNQHMTLFNSKLKDYQMWLKEREPFGDDGKMKNWW